MGQAVRCREQGCAASVWMARHGHGVCRRCPSRITFQGLQGGAAPGAPGYPGHRWASVPSPWGDTSTGALPKNACLTPKPCAPVLIC